MCFFSASEANFTNISSLVKNASFLRQRLSPPSKADEHYGFVLGPKNMWINLELVPRHFTFLCVDN